MGKEGQEDFEKKYPERAKHAKAEYELYAKGLTLILYVRSLSF